MEGYTFCNEMKEIKALLETIAKKETIDDLRLRFPESIDELYLAAGATYERSVHVGRKIRHISVSCPEEVIIQLIINNVVYDWFNNSYGGEDLPNGINVGQLTIKATNTGSEDVAWEFRLTLV